MQFDASKFNLEYPESWLILLMFVGFLGYSYYSLIVLLIYTHRKNQLIVEMEKGIKNREWEVGDRN